MTLEQAIQIAAKAHAGQTDKAGQPYILHPLRIMMRMEAVEERLAAVLHDVVEDTAVTLADLKAAGLSGDALEAVALLTKAKNADYDAYLAPIKQHPVARRVKLADHRHRPDEAFRGVGVVKLSDFQKHLRGAGCHLGREGARHSIWKKASNGKSAAVPRHNEIPPGTVRQICKDLEIEVPKQK